MSLGVGEIGEFKRDRIVAKDVDKVGQVKTPNPFPGDIAQ
jgi:hypothetical protein